MCLNKKTKKQKAEYSSKFLNLKKSSCFRSKLLIIFQFCIHFYSIVWLHKLSQTAVLQPRHRKFLLID